MEFDDYDDDGIDHRAERKGANRRHAEAMRALADELVALPGEQLAQIPLPADIADAVDMGRRITAHGGRRRQLQLIAKLLRQAEVEPIQAALERLTQQSALAIAEHHQAERWRERLLAEGSEAVTAFLAEHPAADRQRLRQLVRAAQQEAAAGKPPKSSRELFRLVRDTLGGA